MKKYLKIGLIQPVINSDLCWNADIKHTRYETLADGSTKKYVPYSINIDVLSAERVWQEIQEGLRLMFKSDSKPNIILIPELHLPVSRINEIKRISKKNNVIIISGVDFQRNPTNPNKVRNRGILTIPNCFDHEGISTRLTTLHFGKTYFTYMEKAMFKNIEGVECTEDQEQNMYVFKSSEFGNFGIMICSDIFDIERMMLYQTEIQHLFIISLNKDLNTYFSMAESLARLLYCNVVVCNTGYYGGSMVVSPYEDPNERIIYKYYGQRMFNTHILSIPIESLVRAQGYNFPEGDKKKDGIKFKASPPGYYDRITSSERD